MWGASSIPAKMSSSWEETSAQGSHLDKCSPWTTAEPGNEEVTTIYGVWPQRSLMGILEHWLELVTAAHELVFLTFPSNLGWIIHITLAKRRFQLRPKMSLIKNITSKDHIESTIPQTTIIRGQSSKTKQSQTSKQNKPPSTRQHLLVPSEDLCFSQHHHPIGW